MKTHKPNARAVLHILAACSLLHFAPSWSADVPYPLLEKRVRILDEATNLAYRGYRIVCPAYEARLACNKDYGYYSFEIMTGGEKLAYTRTFAIRDNGGKQVFAAQERHDSRDDIVLTEEEGRLGWRLSPSAVSTVEYEGSLSYSCTKVALTQTWTLRKDIAGTVTPATDAFI